MLDLPDRFWKKVKFNPQNGCWEWTACTRKGYGRFGVQGKLRSAHHLTFEKKYGQIPDNLVTDHLCRNRACVNPDHLELVTPQENQRRGKKNQYTKMTHCPKGHPYDEKNTYKRKDRPNERGCRICRNEAVARYQKSR